MTTVAVELVELDVVHEDIEVVSEIEPLQDDGMFDASFDILGDGPDALLLPALSSISTRREMHPLAALIASRFRCIIPDWPGFGHGTPAPPSFTPDAMRAFLDVLCTTRIKTGAIGIAAGHAATYLVEAAGRHPGRFGRLVLIAPTWRGPLPTMFDGRHTSACRAVRTLLERPIVGRWLYRINVSRPVMARMIREHVYADAANITATMLEAKRSVTVRPEGRLATAAFVTGGLDPVSSQSEFLNLFAETLPPILLVRPESSPRRSGAEMDALASTGRVVTVTIPGALAAHEEYPDRVAEAVEAYLPKPVESGNARSE